MASETHCPKMFGGKEHIWRVNHAWDKVVIFCGNCGHIKKEL